MEPIITSIELPPNPAVNIDLHLVTQYCLDAATGARTYFSQYGDVPSGLRRIFRVDQNLAESAVSFPMYHRVAPQLLEGVLQHPWVTRLIDYLWDRGACKCIFHEPVANPRQTWAVATFDTLVFAPLCSALEFTAIESAIRGNNIVQWQLDDAILRRDFQTYVPEEFRRLRDRKITVRALCCVSQPVPESSSIGNLATLGFHVRPLPLVERAVLMTRYAEEFHADDWLRPGTSGGLVELEFGANAPPPSWGQVSDEIIEGIGRRLDLLKWAILLAKGIVPFPNGTPEFEPATADLPGSEGTCLIVDALGAVLGRIRRCEHNVRLERLTVEQATTCDSSINKVWNTMSAPADSGTRFSALGARAMPPLLATFCSNQL